MPPIEFSEEHKKLIEETNSLVTDLRTKHEEAEKGKFTQADFKQYEDKLDGRLDKVTARLEEIKAINDRIDSVETKLNRPPGGGGDETKTKELIFQKKAFYDYLRKGFPNLSPEEQKALIISDSTTGGYLAVEETVQEIIKAVTEISPIRTIARVRTTSNLSVNIPKRTGQFSAAWTHETGTRSERTGLTYGLEKATPHEMYALVKVTKQDLEDSAFNLEQEINGEVSEQFGVLEGTAFVSGDSTGKPEGLLTNSDVGEVVSGNANTLTADGIINLVYEPKEPYARNAKFLMKRSTVKAVRLFKDANNQYLWQPAYADGQPQTLQGYPIVEAVDMPAVAANAYPILFGDFYKAYLIIDRIQVEFQRLTELYAEAGQIGIMARKRVDGQVVLAEAIKKQKVSA